MKLLPALALLLPLAAAAQYSGPAAETCRAYAEREIRRDDPRIKAVVLDDDRERNIERVTRKLGSQNVSSLLYGNGAVVNAAGSSLEFSFVCLLADDRRALFFHWLPRRDAPVLAQCRRTGATLMPCLDSLMQLAERDLTDAYAQRFVEARQADGAAGNEARTAAFRRSADAWRAYRDAECARREGPEAARACQVELTRQRLLDLR
jgi:uncharacterized protein YecT (DUF1311 family)